jgi:hypothetical protein
MSESFVDLSYRGLALARRVKLTQVRPSTGYVEMPTPMPVGTHVAIATDDGVAIEAVVAEIHEQIGGATHTPGMLVKPALEGAGADWWKARISAPDPVPEPKADPRVDPEELRRTDPMVPTTIVGKRMTGEVAIPEIVDDGQNTGVMDAVDPEAIVDDGKHTTMMDAVDLEALGLDPNGRPSGEMTAVSPPLVVDDDTETKSPTNGSKRKRKKR